MLNDQFFEEFAKTGPPKAAPEEQETFTKEEVEAMITKKLDEKIAEMKAGASKEEPDEEEAPAMNNESEEE